MLMVRAACALSLLCLVAAPSEGAAFLLDQVPGQDALSARTGRAVNDLCTAFPSPVGPDQNDLFNTCSDFVSQPGSPTASQLDDSLLGLAPDENVEGSSSTQSGNLQSGAVSARLGALRAGATGVAMSGFDLNLNGEHAALLTSNSLSEDSAAGQGGQWPDRLGVFVNGLGGYGSRDARGEELGFRFVRYGATAGADWRFSDEVFAGVAVGWEGSEADFRQSAGGDLDDDQFQGSLYATWSPGSFYVDGIASYSYHDFDVRRRIVLSPTVVTNPGTRLNRTARGDTHANEIGLSVGTGYDFQHEGWSFGPRARFDYTKLKIDGYKESGAGGLNLRVNDQTVRSVATVLGAQASYSISMDWGVLVPQLRVDWEHEFQDDARKVGVRFVSDPNATPFFVKTAAPDRDFANLGFGVSAVLPRGLQAFADFETVLGLQDTESYTLTAGVRWEF